MWEDVNAVHYAKTFSEALEWTALYPYADTMVLIGKRNKLLAARGRW
jgi:hypothetical protein